MAEADNNRRRHVRYRNETTTVLNLEFETKSNNVQQVSALVVNESHSGFCCVYVGTEPVAKGQIVIWRETPRITTNLEVIRCTNVAEDVYTVALEIKN